MKPTKRTRVAKKPRRAKVKRAYDSKSVVGKLIKLKYKINTAYENGEYTTKDRDWILHIISAAKEGKYGRGDLEKANTLWKKYSDMDYTESVEGEMWENIDEFLNANKKINAIKVYKKWMGCDLREAKDVIDARQESINQGWNNVTIVRPSRSGS